VRIVFGGTPDVAVPSLDALADSRHELLAVVTRPDAPSGRGKKLTASRVAQRAVDLGIEVLKPQRPRDEEFVTRLNELAPDCCPVVAYGALLPQRVLDIPRHGWINLHFSLLPAWRGAAPVQHAILAGDQLTGATTFQIVLELDAGPIFATVSEPIRPDDTAGDLLHRLSLSGARLLVDTLDGIEDGTLTPTPQPETDAQVSYASKINVEDAHIDWTQPAEVVDRLIRACSPAPGAWTTFRRERFKINSARISDFALPPGRLEISKRSVRVGTATQALELDEVQAQGKKPMAAADWARGVTFETEPRLGA
jgi:methionyl-tRNA formyltransferase